MKNTYLIDIIRVLTQSELDDFETYLANPCFKLNTPHKDLQELFSAIVRTAPGFSDEDLDKDVIYRQVFPGKQVVNGKLEKLMAEMNKLLRKFLLSREVFHQPENLEQQLDWAKWLRGRSLDNRFQQSMTKLKSNLQAERLESLEFYELTYNLAKEEHEWASTNNRIKGDLNIPNLVHQLDLFYRNYRIELTNRILLLQKAGQINIDIQLGNVEPIGPDNARLEESLLLHLSQQIHELFQEASPSKESFLPLMEWMEQNESKIEPQTLAQSYAYLHSLCTLLIDDGHLELVHTLFLLYKRNLEKGFLFMDGKLGPNAYLNLVQISLRAKELDWAIQFTEAYKNSIVGGDETHFFYHYSRACWLFAIRQFDQALDLLPELSPSPYYHLMVRRLELKIYYELDHELLPYKIDAFRKYLERTAPKSVAAKNNDMNMNFVSMLAQISQSPRKDTKRSVRLVDRIKAKKLIGERMWLLEKAQELG